MWCSPYLVDFNWLLAKKDLGGTRRADALTEAQLPHGHVIVRAILSRLLASGFSHTVALCALPCAFLGSKVTAKLFLGTHSCALLPFSGHLVVAVLLRQGCTTARLGCLVDGPGEQVTSPMGHAFQCLGTAVLLDLPY